MNCNIIATSFFKRELKRLSKHYKSMRQDFAGLLESLRREPQQGVDLGRGLHKVRMAISSKGKGKSGGARVITLTVLISETDTNIVLLTIYDKSECENLTDKELTDIVKKSSL
ncbi:type II toxin-antitoxin system RelE/ParE family toxin [Bacteroides zhangwenhongii]|nr:type II toxin-antitoxin system RelE/ParE family toxin [Bacteroides zhangwenhongii]MDC7136427.1 type II toxin-antitoxin system RelE/ParE family toxin [Bacteroides zhangwenhongii]OKZ22697.1 MAG: addiction module toxin RelE [Bacteroides finegoldii]